MQANSRSAYQFWYKGKKEAQSLSGKLHICMICSLAKQVEIEFFSLYKRFPRYGPIFKTAIFGYETWPLVKVTARCKYALFLPQGSTLSLCSLYGQPFSRYGPIFKISIFEHGIWNVKTGPKVAHVLSFYPTGSKLNLFSLYGPPFSRYGLIFKISISGHETWNLKKGVKVALYTLFLPQGVEIKLIFAPLANVFEIEQFKP